MLFPWLRGCRVVLLHPRGRGCVPLRGFDSGPGSFPKRPRRGRCHQIHSDARCGNFERSQVPFVDAGLRASCRVRDASFSVVPQPAAGSPPPPRSVGQLLREAGSGPVPVVDVGSELKPPSSLIVPAGGFPRAGSLRWFPGPEIPEGIPAASRRTVPTCGAAGVCPRPIFG